MSPLAIFSHNHAQSKIVRREMFFYGDYHRTVGAEIFCSQIFYVCSELLHLGNNKATPRICLISQSDGSD